MRSEHNMWMYVYYSIYLDQIDTSNHNAIEKYVYEKVSSSIGVSSTTVVSYEVCTTIILIC